MLFYLVTRPCLFAVFAAYARLGTLLKMLHTFLVGFQQLTTEERAVGLLAHAELLMIYAHVLLKFHFFFEVRTIRILARHNCLVAILKYHAHHGLRFSSLATLWACCCIFRFCPIIKAVTTHDGRLAFVAHEWIRGKAHANATLLLSRHISIGISSSLDEFAEFVWADSEEVLQLDLISHLLDAAE